MQKTCPTCAVTRAVCDRCKKTVDRTGGASNFGMAVDVITLDPQQAPANMLLCMDCYPAYQAVVQQWAAVGVPNG